MPRPKVEKTEPWEYNILKPINQLKKVGSMSATRTDNHWCESCGGEGCGFCKETGVIANGSCFPPGIVKGFPDPKNQGLPTVGSLAKKKKVVKNDENK